MTLIKIYIRHFAQNNTLMTRHIFILVLLIFLGLQTSFGQNVATTEPQSIDGKFENLLKTSNNFEEYKVIKKYRINQLRENTKKHIEGLNSQIGNLEGNINTLSSEIAQLKTSLSNTQTTLEDTNLEKDSMSFFGSQMSKSSYNTMVWSIAGVLLLGLLFFIFKYKNGNILTKQAQRKLDDLEYNFEDYKRKSLEKEQKLGRQLQDERNKLAQALKG